MSNKDDEKELPNDAELLLPWYVAGTLSEEEIAKVDAWLATDPEAEAHLARAQEEWDVTITASEELGMPRASAVNDLMASIGAKNHTTTAVPALLERIWEMLSPRYAMAGAAALALVVVGQSITIGTMMSDTPATYEVASDKPAVAISELTALAAFQPNITISQITDYLAELNLTIIDGPKPGGIYQLAATDNEAGKSALDTLASNNEFVRFFSAAQ